MTTALSTLTSNLAKQFNMGDGSELADTLKQTCFKGNIPVTDAQMTALLVVAQQYGLNPFTKEIFAFPDKGGIIPVVGVDGWARIINSNPQFDGMDFEQDETSCTCIIYRKDRSHPIRITEWMQECKRGAGPWTSHPYRMLRHKAMIQCARIAFGFGGIYDADEAERIIESIPEKAIDPATGEIKAKVKELPTYTADQFNTNMATWRRVIETKRKTVDEVLDTIATIATLTAEQEAQIRKIETNTVEMEAA